MKKTVEGDNAVTRTQHDIYTLLETEWGEHSCHETLNNVTGFSSSRRIRMPQHAYTTRVAERSVVIVTFLGEEFILSYPRT